MTCVILVPHPLVRAISLSAHQVSSWQPAWFRAPDFPVSTCRSLGAMSCGTRCRYQATKNQATPSVDDGRASVKGLDDKETKSIDESGFTKTTAPGLWLCDTISQPSLGASAAQAYQARGCSAGDHSVIGCSVLTEICYCSHTPDKSSGLPEQRHTADPCVGEDVEPIKICSQKARPQCSNTEWYRRFLLMRHVACLASVSAFRMARSYVSERSRVA